MKAAGEEGKSEKAVRWGRLEELMGMDEAIDKGV